MDKKEIMKCPNDKEMIELAVHLAQTTRFLLEDDAKTYVMLELRAMNNEIDCYSDDFIEEAEFFNILKEFDRRFE